MRSSRSGAVPFASLLGASVLAAPASAECWVRADGSEICSPEPLAWRVAGWFWFTALLAVFAFLCCQDAACGCCCCCSCRRRKRAPRDVDEDADADAVRIRDDLTEPLLPPLRGKGAAATSTASKPQRLTHWPLLKPQYRYIDP